MAKVIPIWRKLEVHRACRALVFPFAKAGNSIPARMAMMATTTSSSINVKASREERSREEGFMAMIGKDL
jgi:hypothetical protein